MVAAALTRLMRPYLLSLAQTASLSDITKTKVAYQNNVLNIKARFNVEQSSYFFLFLFSLADLLRPQENRWRESKR